MADGEPGDQMREAAWRVLPVPGCLRAARWRGEDLRGFRAAVDRARACGVDAGRGVRRPRIPPHLLRHVDGPVARGGDPNPAAGGESPTSQGWRSLKPAAETQRRRGMLFSESLRL